MGPPKTISPSLCTETLSAYITLHGFQLETSSCRWREGGREGERERKLKSTKGGMPNIGKVDNTGQLVFEHSLDLHTKIDLLN
jgi:hypothetical protein